MRSRVGVAEYFMGVFLIERSTKSSPGWLPPAAIGGERPAAPDRRAPQRESGGRSDQPGRAGGEAGKGKPDEQGGGQSGGGDVELGAEQDRRLARQHVADDAAEAAGEHAHREGGERREAVGEPLRRAE